MSCWSATLRQPGRRACSVSTAICRPVWTAPLRKPLHRVASSVPQNSTLSGRRTDRQTLSSDRHCCTLDSGQCYATFGAESGCDEASAKPEVWRPGITLFRTTAERPGVRLFRTTAERPGVRLCRRTAERPGIRLCRMTAERPGVTMFGTTAEHPGVRLCHRTSESPKLISMPRQPTRISAWANLNRRVEPQITVEQ